MRTLKYGCVGNDVKWYQYYLNQVFNNAFHGLYEPLEVDGRFGELTKERTILYQTWKKLKADGKVGPKTKEPLGLSDFAVWILDPKEYDLWVGGTPYGARVKPLKTLDTWLADEKCDLVWNLALFNSVGTGNDQFGVIKGRTLTYCRGKGHDIGYGGTPEIVRLDHNNAFAGYRVAIKNGVAQKVAIAVKRARNANGVLKDGRYFVVQSVTCQTEAALRDYMQENYDVDLMLIQDGGGSVGFRDSGGTFLACEREGNDGRPVATVLCAKKK